MFSYIREELPLRKYIEVAKKLLKRSRKVLDYCASYNRESYAPPIFTAGPTVVLPPERPELGGYSARTCAVARVHCLLAMGLRLVSRAEAKSGLRCGYAD